MNKGLIAVGVFLAGIPTLAVGVNSAIFFPTGVPTLDEVGLLGLAIVVAVAGGIAARRRKRK